MTRWRDIITTDIHLLLLSSKSNPPVLFLALQQPSCWGLPHLSQVDHTDLLLTSLQQLSASYLLLTQVDTPWESTDTSVRKGGGITIDLHLSLCSSHSNAKVSSPASVVDHLLWLFTISFPIPKGQIISWWHTLLSYILWTSYLQWTECLPSQPISIHSCQLQIPRSTF